MNKQQASDNELRARGWREMADAYRAQRDTLISALRDAADALDFAATQMSCSANCAHRLSGTTEACSEGCPHGETLAACHDASFVLTEVTQAEKDRPA